MISRDHSDWFASLATATGGNREGDSCRLCFSLSLFRRSFRFFARFFYCPKSNICGNTVSDTDNKQVDYFSRRRRRRTGWRYNSVTRECYPIIFSLFWSSLPYFTINLAIFKISFAVRTIRCIFPSLFPITPSSKLNSFGAVCLLFGRTDSSLVLSLWPKKLEK